MNKPVAILIIVVLLGLGFVALIFGGTIPGSTDGRRTVTSLNESQSSSMTSPSGTNSNSLELGMNVIPNDRLVPLGGKANFTMALSTGSDLTGGYSLSAAAPSGLSLRFDPVLVAMSGAGSYAGVLQVSSSGEMSPGTYLVTIAVTGPKGVANQTLDFHVQRNLVLIGISTGKPLFSNLTVKAGDSVTWFSYQDALSDSPNGWHQVIFDNMNLASGPIRQFKSWSHTFTQPGVYKYHDDADPTITGEVVVAP